MNVIFISNYYNHHQSEISAELDKLTQHNFCFIETAAPDSERTKLGWCQGNVPKFVTTYSNELCCADAAIVGSAPEKIVQEVIRRHILTFRYSERPLKHGTEPIKYIPRLFRWHKRNLCGKPIYLLCASAYTSYDYAKFGLFRGRAYKWGYFPQTRHYPDIGTHMQRKNRKRILWCGRFLDWKHPDDAIRAAEMLKNDGMDFSMDFIGTGPMEETMRGMIDELKLSDYVHILAPMTPDKVRDEMEKAGIYLFTSDRQEGWGAVLNEAMNSGCAVVAGHLIGSVPYLVNDKENGFVYRSGDVSALYEKVKYLLNETAEQDRLGRSAYKTITEEWNAEIAADRFIKLAEAILDGDKSPNLYASGPCSRAEIIREDWFSE